MTPWLAGAQGVTGFGDEPRDFLEGNQRGEFIGVIPSFLAENQQVVSVVRICRSSNNFC